MKESNIIVSKPEQIIEVAQRLFGLYGVERVSMLEIATELHLSKASLYYYFPDKESLYRAVIEKEQAEFISRISGKLARMNNPEKMLLEYVRMRLDYFSRLINLSRLRMEAFADMKPVFKATGKNFKEKEMVIVKQIFNLGVEKKVWKINNADEVASLFLDILKGLRVTSINDRHTMVLNPSEFEMLNEKIETFAKIFSNGLKNR
jgi:AcrR family transcriptional regulator